MQITDFKVGDKIILKESFLLNIAKNCDLGIVSKIYSSEIIILMNNNISISIHKDKLHTNPYCIEKLLEINETIFSVGDKVKINTEMYLKGNKIYEGKIISINNDNSFPKTIVIKTPIGDVFTITESQFKYLEKIEKQNYDILNTEMCISPEGITVKTDNNINWCYKSEKIKEENKMECKDLLRMWINKNEKELDNKKAKEKEKLLYKDEIAIATMDCKTEVFEIVKKYEEKFDNVSLGIKLDFYDIYSNVTDDTLDKFHKLDSKYDDLKSELRNIANEVNTAISICENEDSLRKILKAYNIIDKDGKIKVK